MGVEVHGELGHEDECEDLRGGGADEQGVAGRPALTAKPRPGEVKAHERYSGGEGEWDSGKETGVGKGVGMGWRGGGSELRRRGGWEWGGVP